MKIMNRMYFLQLFMAATVSRDSGGLFVVGIWHVANSYISHIGAILHIAILHTEPIYRWKFPNDRVVLSV